MDMSMKPLLRIFEGKMRSAELLAKRKGLEFVVEDETTATEAGILKTLDRSRASEDDLEIDCSRECK